MRVVQRPTRRPHPTLLGLYVLSWGIAVYSVHTVAQQVVMLTVVLGVLSMTSADGRGGTRLLAWSVPMMFLYTLVSSLFGISDGVVLWYGPHIPTLGTLTISTGGIRDSLLRTLRLWDLLTFLVIVMRRIRPDDIAHGLGRRFARVSLTLSMILNFMPTLLAERRRVADMVVLRGAIGSNTARSTRLRAQAVVYQTLLMNALDRSWRLAESMHVRGYGSARRTNYKRAKWYRVDIWMGTVLLAALGVDIGWLVFARVGKPAWIGMSPLAWGTTFLQVVCMLWLGGRVRVRRADRTALIRISGGTASGD